MIDFNAANDLVTYTKLQLLKGINIFVHSLKL
jgi:hypothetical protein